MLYVQLSASSITWQKMVAPGRRNLGDARLLLYIALGGLLGGAFVAFDLVAEAHIGAGTLAGPMGRAHDIIDHVLPIVVGGLLGLSAHYFTVRARLHVAEDRLSRADALRARLQKVERDQAVWVLSAAILHELNNPLQALGLLLDELSSVAPGALDHGELLARARGQSERVRSALQRLRTLRSADDEPQCRAIRLDPLITSLAADASALAAEDGLQVQVDCSRSVSASADPVFLRTILENLIHNSLQSLRARGSGRLSITLVSEAEFAVVRVSDDGPALEPEVRNALFVPLVTTKRDGLGLGLPIARALARSMRGDLRLDDIESKVFRLELPRGEQS